MLFRSVPGGDLRRVMTDFSINEEGVKFYAAEILVALESLHDFRFVHRDITPENILLDSEGHVKLADFGSCISISVSGKAKGAEMIGTPDYVAPEILLWLEGQESEYDQSVDIWSLGVIIYEMIYRRVPFGGTTFQSSYETITNHEKHLNFPDHMAASNELKDLLGIILTSADKRVGRVNGCRELKKHPWFSTIDWDCIRRSKPYFIPDLSAVDDFKYFNCSVEPTSSLSKPKATKLKTKDYQGNNLCFVGYTDFSNFVGNLDFKKNVSPVELSKQTSNFRDSTNSFKTDGRNSTTSARIPNIQSPMAKLPKSSSLKMISDLMVSPTFKSLTNNNNSKSSSIGTSNMEKELSALRLAILKENTVNQCLTTKLLIAEKEMASISAEFGLLKLVYQQDAIEKTEMSQKLQQLEVFIKQFEERALRKFSSTQSIQCLQDDFQASSQEILSSKLETLKVNHNLLESQIHALADELAEEKDSKKTLVIRFASLLIEKDKIVAERDYTSELPKKIHSDGIGLIATMRMWVFALLLIAITEAVVFILLYRFK